MTQLTQAAPARPGVVVEALGNKGLMILVSGGENPTHAQWDAVLETVEQTVKTCGSCAILVHAGAGGPTVEQRVAAVKRLRPLMRRTRTAVLTDSAIARGVLTAFRWVQPELGGRTSALRPGDLAEALAFLQVDDVDVESVADRLKALREMVGPQPGR